MLGTGTPLMMARQARATDRFVEKNMMDADYSIGERVEIYLERTYS